jgi:predicted nucleotidyltransferase
MMNPPPTLNSHGTWRLELARQKIAVHYAAHPKVEAIYVFGSVSYGCADEYSDIEIGVIWSEAPEESELAVIAEAVGATSRRGSHFIAEIGALVDEYAVDGVKIETGHMARALIEALLDDVVHRNETSLPKQNTISSIQQAIDLCGSELLDSWRDTAAHYPDALARHMVESNLKFASADNRLMVAQRNEIPLLYENACNSERRILSILLGLNRIYYPGFKWTRLVTQQMPIAPPDLFARLKKVFQSDAQSGTRVLNSLIEETFQLVKRHLPQIDIAQTEAAFHQPCPTWHRPARAADPQ